MNKNGRNSLDIYQIRSKMIQFKFTFIYSSYVWTVFMQLSCMFLFIAIFLQSLKPVAPYGLRKSILKLWAPIL